MRQKTLFSLKKDVDISYREVLSPEEYQEKNINMTNLHLRDLEGDLQFCYNILPSVSRTFAISINHLKGNLHLAVFTGYLFCRIADTIEDAWKISIRTKQKLFDLFDEIIVSSCQEIDENKIASFEKLSRELTGDVTHLNLCQNSIKVFRIFSCLPQSTQKIIAEWVSTMVRGMRYFVTKYPTGVKIQTIKEYREYCFYVAGTVGHMLTGLWRLHGPKQKKKQEKILNQFSASFGEGLQTINILKDVANDAEVENNFYIPEQLLKKKGSSHREITTEKKREFNYQAVKEMIVLAEKNLNNAFSYYCALPWLAFRIKLFCIAPLLFAFATLKELKTTQDMLVPGKKVKFSHKKLKIYLILSHLVIFNKHFALFVIKKFVIKKFKK